MGVSSYVYAEEALSVKETISEALKSNPEILAAKRSYEAASARIWQAASLSDPMVELEYDKITADRMLTGDPMKTYAISQDIPFPTKLYLRAKIASKLARVAYESYKAKEREILSEVKSAYAELFIVYRSIDVQKENRQILEQFLQVATPRYTLGKSTQADVLKAQVELARAENNLIILEQKRVSAQARLNILLNRDPKEEMGVPAPEEPVGFTRSLEDFYVMAKADNPELKAYRYAIERGKAAYDLSLNEFMPDFNLRFKQMVKKGRVEENAWAGMLGVTIPLWFFQKQAFGVKEMKAELEMLEAEYKTKENMVLFDVRDSYARTQANKKLIELYLTSFIPQAEQTVAAALKGYETEKADFLTLLDSQRMLIEFKLEYYSAILELRMALADLERAVGIDVDF
jgi:outer membrane protein TolC